MSCVPTTLTEYSTTRQTLRTEVWTTSTRSIPIFTAITTSDGQVFTPIRVVEVSSVVEVTTVVASLIPARTVVVECTDSVSTSPISSSVAASSPSHTSAAGPSSISSSTFATTASFTSALLPSSAVSSPESTTTSVTTTITLTVPPTSSASARPATPSSSINDTDSSGALSPQAAEEELSKGTIGGLAAGGVGLFVLILVALWFVQRQFGKGIGKEGPGGGVVGKRTRKGGRGGQGGSGQYRGMRDGGSVDQTSEKLAESDRPPPLLPPVIPHTRWSAITLPPMFRPAAPIPRQASLTSALNYTTTDNTLVTVRGASHIRHTSAPLNLQNSARALRRPEHHPAISPTPASLNRLERAQGVGSVWNRLSALTWRMSWSLSSPDAASTTSADDLSKRHTGKSDTGREIVAVVDIPTIEIGGSARVGRIPSMVDLREIGHGIKAVSQAELKPSRSRAGSGLSTPPHLAPARPSSEYIREEDKPVDIPLPGGLPPPPMRSNSLVRNQSKRSMSVKSINDGEHKKISARRSGRSETDPPESHLGRMIAGYRRSDASLKGNSRSSRGSAREGSRTWTSGPLKLNQDLYAFPALKDLYAPSAYAQPGVYPASILKDRRPPSLHFAREASMPRLWIPDQSIAAFNPDSAHQTPREITDSAYDGMTEIDFTPLSAVRRVTPRPTGKEVGGKGLPKIPPLETSASNSFKADWAAAVSAH